MPLYDLMLLLDPGAPSDRHDTILKEVQALLDSGGKIVTTQEWGTRRMAFEIDHRPEADYHLLQFETEKGGALLERVDHSLKIMDGVLRHRIIRLKDGSAPPPAPRPEGRREGYGEAEGAPAGDGAQVPAGEAGAAPVETAAPDASSLPPEEGQPAGAPAIAGTAAAGIPAAPSDAPAPAPAETPPPPDVDADQTAGPAGGGGDDEAPSGPTAA